MAHHKDFNAVRLIHDFIRHIKGFNGDQVKEFFSQVQLVYDDWVDWDASFTILEAMAEVIEAHKEGREVNKVER